MVGGLGDAKAHPLIGSGTGSYEKQWLLHRSFAANTVSAHSLWLERLAENGIVGLLLLAAAMLAPLVAAFRMRGAVHVPAAAGAYVAFLVHAGVDWDWLLPTLTLAAIWTGSALLATEPETVQVALPAWGRWAAGASAATVAVVAAFSLAGNLAVADGAAAASDGHFQTAIGDYTRAADRQPWSAEPWMEIGAARLALGDTAGAEAAYRTAIRRDGSDWDAWFRLANLLTGDARTQALLKARSLNPRSPEIDHLCYLDGEPGCVNIRHRAEHTG